MVKVSQTSQLCANRATVEEVVASEINDVSFDEVSALSGATDNIAKQLAALQQKNESTMQGVSVIKEDIAEAINEKYDTPVIASDTSLNEYAPSIRNIEKGITTQNTKTTPGYVTAGSGQKCKVWKTDENGNPGWRTEEGPSRTGSAGYIATLTDINQINGLLYQYWSIGAIDATYASQIGIDKNTGDFYVTVLSYNGDGTNYNYGNLLISSPRLDTVLYHVAIWKKVAVAKKVSDDDTIFTTAPLPIARGGTGQTDGTFRSPQETRQFRRGYADGAIIQSTVTGSNKFVMLDKLPSTNGIFMDGVYGTRRNFYYVSNDVIAAGDNGFTKQLVLLDENGDSDFPGNVLIRGNLTTASGKVPAIGDLAGAVNDTTFKENFRQLVKGDTANGNFIKVVKTNMTIDNMCTTYGVGLAMGQHDTQTWLSIDRGSPHVYVGGGMTTSIKWCGELAMKSDLTTLQTKFASFEQAKSDMVSSAFGQYNGLTASSTISDLAKKVVNHTPLIERARAIYNWITQKCPNVTIIPVIAFRGVSGERDTFRFKIKTLASNYEVIWNKCKINNAHDSAYGGNSGEIEYDLPTSCPIYGAARNVDVYSDIRFYVSVRQDSSTTRLAGMRLEYTTQGNPDVFVVCACATVAIKDGNNEGTTSRSYNFLIVSV